MKSKNFVHFGVLHNWSTMLTINILECLTVFGFGGKTETETESQPPKPKPIQNIFATETEN